MALHLTVEEHDANPPESWVVVKVSERLWHLRERSAPASHGPLQSTTTKREAERLKVEGFYVNLYEKEGRHFAEVERQRRSSRQPEGWRPIPRGV